MLESFASKTRNKVAALSFIKRMMKRHCSPRAIVTDRCRSYGAAMKEIGNADHKETAAA
ncbi:MAG: DDE-type integrase/transposase/recombinase [Janthinobacterium lividum]